MAAQLRAVDRPDPERNRRFTSKIEEIPDNQLACRAGRHKWPGDDLEAGKPLPKGLKAIPTAQRGVYQLVDECQRCGKVRRMDTLPRGVYDVSAEYSYADPKDWVTVDPDLDVTKRDLRQENFRRNAKRLFG
jgi:hypothetical protein